MSSQEQSLDSENDTIGLNSLSNMLVELSVEHEKNNYYFLCENALHEAIELNPYSADALEALAIYHEITNRMPVEAERYYLKALELDPENCRILYNFGNFYEEKKDYQNMIKYFTLATELDDPDSYLSLARYYLKICDNKELFLLNYIKGVDLSSSDNDEDDEEYNYSKKYKGYNHFNLLATLETIDDPSEKIKFIINKLKRKPDILIYNNKVRLFSKFENICECQICFEQKLNIDLHCGHETCIDCYKIIYKKNCPWCRTSSYFEK
jgi:tetratricopeptide (TPR) repeat protein